MKPSIPKGTRDFGPEEVRKRQYLFAIIREAFVRFGYEPVETPSLENLETLTGKYGEEGDKLLFKVLTHVAGEEGPTAKRGLRYDLTVPFARFVVMHQHQLRFPFKRYQIQPVWRADRPQKGRYQEFFQCDADVVGSPSLMYEAELVSLFDQVFTHLGIPVRIEVNHRMLLAGMAVVAGLEDQFTSMTTAVDKWDKIGPEGVAADMERRGISPAKAAHLLEILQHNDLEYFRDLLADSPIGTSGIEEMDVFLRYLAITPTRNPVVFTPLLARGLGYYTGCIFEVKPEGEGMGSIGGGGRYADLTGIFGMQGMPGVGISFGAERIYDIMEARQLFPSDLTGTLKILFAALDSEAHHYAFGALQQVRNAGIPADLYPEPDKLKKPLKYAADRRIPFVAIAGEAELALGHFMLKDMTKGTQESLPLAEIIQRLS